MANDDFSELLAPALGILGLLGLALFGLGNQNKPANNGLPPPPVNKKPGGCGCTASAGH